MSKVIIIGGGVTGLAAAYLAAKQGAQVTLLEAGDAIGGLLQTFDVGSAKLEYFYHHHFREDTEFFWLLRELGIEDKLKFHSTTMGIYRGGRRYDFNTPLDLLKFKPLKFFDKVRFVLTSLYLAKFARWQKGEGTPSIEWFRRHAGKSAAECIWEPMHRIKFGDYTGVVPLTWMIGRMRQRLNSRKGARETLGYVAGSLNTLLVAMEEKLKSLGVEIVLNARVTEIIIEDGNARGVKVAPSCPTLKSGAIFVPSLRDLTAALSAQGGLGRSPNNNLPSLREGLGVGEENKQKFSADEILFTAPTNILAPLVAPHDPTYASELSTIEYFGALCVVVETSRPLSGIYWLNVADPGFPFGGIIEHTNLIPPCVYGGRCVTYLSRYFEFGNPLASAPEEEIKREFIAGLKKIYPTLCDDEILKVNCFRTRSAAVVVDLNFSAKVPGYKTPIGNFYLASMPQLYPDERSVNNSIRLASDAVAAMGYKNLAPQGSTLAGVVARGK